MTVLARVKRKGWAMPVLLALAGQATFAPPAMAQHPEATSQELRIRQLEAQVRVLQRQAFPDGGDTAAVSVPVATPMTDVLTRMDALEAQVARLTAHSEEMSNHLREIDARLAAQTPPAPPPPAAAPARDPAPIPLLTAPPASPSRPSSSRTAAVKAVVKTQTDNPGEDEYIYGYKLWQARLYPEAEQQLQLFLSKYPKHRRVSYARNLLGRAYLDDGNPREAAEWFVRNYQADKNGDRAADSILYLARAMIELKDTGRACIALSEFGRSYANDATQRLKADYDRIRAAVSCNN